MLIFPFSSLRVSPQHLNQSLVKMSSLHTPHHLSKCLGLSAPSPSPEDSQCQEHRQGPSYLTARHLSCSTGQWHIQQNLRDQFDGKEMEKEEWRMR